MIYYSYLYEKENHTAYFKLFLLYEKNPSDNAGASMSCKARFSFHSPHKLLDIAHLYRLNI